MTDFNPEVLEIFDDIRNLWADDQYPSWDRVRDRLIALVDVHTADVQRLRSAIVTGLNPPALVFEPPMSEPNDTFSVSGVLHANSVFGHYLIIPGKTDEWSLTNAGLCYRCLLASQSEAIEAANRHYLDRANEFIKSLE